LWQAEDIDAVFDQDPERVCILQGPVAVTHSKVKDKPIKDMFGNIAKDLIKKLLGWYHNGNVSKVPTVDHLAPPTPPATLVKLIEAKGNITFRVPTPVPDTGI
jgi:enoyl reductase-like protein